MKKYIMAFSLTIVLSLLIMQAGNVYKGSFVQVSAVKVNPVTAESSIYCNNGKVERADTRSVYAEAGYTVKEIHVKKGEKVVAGQQLLSLVPITQTVGQVGTTSLDESTYQELLNTYYNQIAGGGAISVGGLASSFASGESQPTESREKSAAEPIEITAPINGEITQIAVTEQGLTEPSKPVITLATTSDLQVRLSVNESQISEIKVGQKAMITGAGFKSSYEGTVTAISTEAQQQYNTTGSETVVEVLVRIKNPKSDIKPGFSAKAKIITEQSRNVLVAPYEAVRADDDGNEYVYILNGKKAVKNPVTTRKEFEAGLEIVSGLRQQDEIIVNPDAVSDGDSVILQGTVSSDG